MSSKRLLWMATLLALLPGVAAAQATGQLTGTVTGADGKPIAGVTVVVSEAAMADITDERGGFRLTGVPAGTYVVSFSLGDRVATAEGVEVRAGEATSLNQQLEWEVSFAETITVYSASRQRERIVEAPAAVTVVSEADIEREASHGQLAKVLEFTPGAEVTQSGLYDFNVNTRGFNSSLNRRVPALLDGRDPNVPFLMSVDWPSLSSLGDMASVELVRGPSSALYGTNAFNGVLVLTSKQPRFSQGGTVRLTAGELSTARGDVRWAGELGAGTYLKVNGGYTQSDDFYVSRTAATGVEYGACSAADRARRLFGCLPLEAVPVAVDEDELWLAGVRLDKYFGDSFLTLEGGTSHAEGPVIQTGIGRVQILEQDRPWARLNFSHPRFNVLAYHNQRDAPEQLALAAGRNLILDEESWAVEVQGNLDFAQQKGRIIGGASYKDEEIDTKGTLTLDPVVGGDRQAVYTQVEYAFTPKLKAVVAGRWDDSSLHDDQISPKVALVLAPTPNQTVRLTYNQAFQSPNYSEFFLFSPAGAPITGLLAGAAANPASAPLVPVLTALGFGSVPILAFGNPALDVEEISTWEIGYSGILGGKAFVTLDYYNSELDNFVTDLLPGVNPAFAPYAPTLPLPPQASAGVLAFLRAALQANFVGLTTVNGKPALVFSYNNAGSAETQGIDFGLNYYVSNQWNVGVSYSWFDFELTEESLTGDKVLPNAPEHQAIFSLGYVGERFDASIGYRWVDDFGWAAGVFAGPVLSYDTVDLVANYRVSPHVQLGLNVTNALDDDHYQSFGGDVLGRRALGSVTFSW